LIDNKGYSTKTVRESLSSLKECFNAAISNKLTNTNPCNCVTVKDDNLVSERVVMSESQQNLFMQVAKNRYYSELYQILLSTGMRVGELTALQWQDVDFDNKVIHIRYSMQTAYCKGKKILNMTTPKTSNSVRDIPMFEGVDEMFKKWRVKQETTRNELRDRWRLPTEFSDLVFTTSLGSPVTRYVLSTDINKIVQIIDRDETFMAIQEHREPVMFPKVHPHSFRHTFATRCFEKNLKPLFIMNIMGHSNYETTLSYTHVLSKVNEEQVSVAGSFVS
jgi:integrase